MSVRAKFTCQSVTNYGGSITDDLMATYSTIGENKDFTDSTPSGSLKISIIKDKPAASFFEPGKSYCLDFTEAPAQ